MPAERVNKVREGSPHIVDLIEEGKVQLVINTPLGGLAHQNDSATPLSHLSL
ncbi:MAG: hypothetical protein AAFN11_17770 [Chloroflexota bacterium]